MIRRPQAGRFFANRKARRDRMLEKMRRMRAAKERKRLENPIDREPKMQRWYPLELGVRDKSSGEVAWTDLHSIRDATRRIAAVVKYYQPV